MPDVNNAAIGIQQAAQLLSASSFQEAVKLYDSILVEHPGFAERFLKNSANKQLHDSLAKHSLIQQSHQNSESHGYSFDIGRYLVGGGIVRVTKDIAIDVSAFKGTVFGGSEAWAKHVELVFDQYRDTLFRGCTDRQSLDWSPTYFALWVLSDFQQIEPFIPSSTQKVADIGCGMGGINAFIAQTTDTQKSFTLYETEADALNGAHKFLSKNSVASLDGSDDGRPFDLIISMRSCCYLYSYKEYEPIFQQTRSGSSIIVDVSIDKYEETLSFFSAFCNYKIPLYTGDANYHRYVFIR
ncbi:MAG: methyltransferase [Rhodospirillaceae bacterium]|nr:methyltransferase [Rhodospirillaceae bacterium]